MPRVFVISIRNGTGNLLPNSCALPLTRSRLSPYLARNASFASGGGNVIGAARNASEYHDVAAGTVAVNVQSDLGTLDDMADGAGVGKCTLGHSKSLCHHVPRGASHRVAWPVTCAT
jgi:hypothetical protein